MSPEARLDTARTDLGGFTQEEDTCTDHEGAFEFSYP